MRVRAHFGHVCGKVVHRIIRISGNNAIRRTAHSLFQNLLNDIMLLQTLKSKTKRNLKLLLFVRSAEGDRLKGADKI
jgi:hypothetical protein